MLSASSHIVIAEFEVRPECFAEFIAIARRFSEECVESEPGCWQFDVVQLETTPGNVLFYEVYDGTSAFEAHCQSTHLVRFRKAFKKLIVAERPIRRGSRSHAAL